MEKSIDLHTHSSFSDGTFTPDELIKHAIDNNIKILAITDHDNVDGLKSINKEKYNDITIIDGIEFSAKIDKGSLHILGYDIDINNSNLNNKIKTIKDYAINNFIALLVQIKKDYGISFSYEDILEVLNSRNSLGSTDIAKLLYKYGYVNSIEEAFNLYLRNSYNKTNEFRNHVYYIECIDVIRNSGGIPVLAHPKTLKMTYKELLLFVRKLIDCGLMGIEVYHSKHNEDDVNMYLDIANKYNLLISGGSDFHGENKPNVKIGTGIDNNLKIKELSIVDYIKSYK